ncbi:MAG: Cys-tRNA(Pro) deacylase [Clostridia bacterium]|nr:Cys-tRNA(Pro) deacylase [Clostridia bacterium]
MAKKEEEKTNVMRVLDAKKVKYVPHIYADTPTTVGTEIAAVLGENPDSVYKTLVTVGKSGGHYVFVIPVAKELDLKKAARASGEKSIEMIPQKELLPLTGYIHGGCSPIGMKKFFPTFVDSSAEKFETICYSAGKVGYQVETSPMDLASVIRLSYADLTKE